ncbi:MAG TPA: hypothetical protein VFR24_27185, partial [Candidatus Angelobacter sp.]|nr:hypothetical protein [Candidatus Angelobacter sp.]
IEDALMLTLLGQRTFRNNDSVTGSELTDGLRQSGLNVGRVDWRLEKFSDVCSRFQTSRISANVRSKKMRFMLTLISSYDYEKTKNPPFGGSGLWPSKHGGFTAHDWPSLAASPVASFQAAQFREYEQHGVKVKTERSLVLEQNCDCGHVRVNFDSFKGLALNLSKAQQPCVSLAGTGSLTVSHDSPFYEGDLWLGLLSCGNTIAARFLFRGSCETWQEKSELPKNYQSCPINRREMLVIGQSQ